MPAIDGERWRALEPLLDRALELSGGERESWLAAVREHTPDLATDLVAMLSADVAADERGFLTEPLIGAEPSLEGLALGAYTLDHPLGHGGMGSVWLAHRSDGLYAGRAAVKLLNLALLTPSGQTRFRREGSMLARLAHPGIAHLLDAGVASNHQPYLVLEYVEGQPIDSYSRAHDLSTDDRLRLFMQVLDAVGHAHANLIVHRDLKPSNILVTPNGTVKLLDFGIAKLLESDAASDGVADKTLALTPQYAAPEQVMGGAITTATDVYALGVLLYNLLSGRHPTAEGCMTAGDIIVALRERQPAVLPLGDLGAVVDKALRKDPSERYQAVGAFAEDVRHYLAHEPVTARGNPVLYRVAKFVRRHAAATAGMTVVAVALIAATVFSIAQMRNARRERDAAVFAGNQAAGQVEFLSILTGQLGERPLSMRDLLDRARIALERQHISDPRLRASLLVQLSERYADLTENTHRGELLASAESLAVTGGHANELAEIRCNMADNLRTEGRYPEAREMLASADTLLRTHPDAAVEATCLQARGDLQIEVGPHEGTVPLMQRAIAIHDSLQSTRGMAYAGLLSDFAGALDDDGRHREAIAVHQRVSALLDSAGLGSTMLSVVNEHDMALAVFKLGETAEGERLFHHVVERAKEADTSGRLPQQVLIHFSHAALFQQHFDTAAKYFGILAAQGRSDKNTYWQGRALFGLAEAEIGSGRLTDAKRTMRTFQPISTNPKLQSSDDQLVEYRVLEARLALATGDITDARRLVTEALRRAGYFQGKRKQTYWSTLVLAADLALRTSDAASAATFARDARSLATRDSLTLRRSAFVGAARLMEARAMLASGDTTNARDTLAAASTDLDTGAGPDHPQAREARALLGQLQTAMH